MNEAMKNLLTRRSVRKYKPEQITDEELRAVLEAGTYAPTARIDLAEGVQLSGTAITARSCTISIGKDTMVGVRTSIPSSARRRSSSSSPRRGT